ncbi:MAG: hypothetical protein WA906_13545, partial [Pacificimonas sp.]
MRPVIGLSLFLAVLLGWLLWRSVAAFDATTTLLAGLEPVAEREADPTQTARTDISKGEEEPRLNMTALAGSSSPDATIRSDRVVDLTARNSRRTAQLAALDEAVDRAQTSQIPTQSPQLAAPRTPAPPQMDVAKPIEPKFDFAAAAYRALAQNDRREARLQFGQALEQQAGDPRADLWRAELSALEKQWRFNAYGVARDGTGAVGLTRDGPGFAGAQLGIGAAYRIDPVARRPVDLEARLVHTPAQAGADAVAEATVGASWRPFGNGKPMVAVERRIAIDGPARDAFQIRAAGGLAGGGARFDLRAYADAG